MLTVIDILFILLSFIGIYFLVLFFTVFVSERKKIRKLPKLKRLPSVSVIIPAYNKEKLIAKTVSAVKSLRYPKKLLEIIVVDDGSADRTYDVVKKIKGIKVFRKRNGGKAEAINYGIERAKGEIIACVDADSYPEKDSLIKAVQFFSDKKTAGVTVSVLVKNANNMLQKLQKIEYILLILSRKLLESLNCIYVTPGPLALYRKDVIKQVGGFDTKNMTEDIEIAWRLLKYGYKVKMSVDSIVYTDVPGTLKDWWRQRIRWNIGGAQTTLKYFGNFFKKPSNVGMFLLPLFTLSFILTLIGLGMFFYIVLSAVHGFVFVYMRSLLMGVGAIRFSLSLTPDILTIVGLFVFAVSMVWLKLSLSIVKDEISIRKNIPEFIVYILFYIAIHPFNLIAAVWKLLRKSYEW